MAEPSVANILKIPGRLSHSPTDLSLPYPHGGTAIGTCGAPEVTASSPGFVERAEEFGNAASDIVWPGNDWLMTAELREVMDAAALAFVMPVYAVGAAGGPLLSSEANGSVRAGLRLGEQHGRVLVFTPNAEDDHPWLVAYRAVPAIDETVRLAFRGGHEAHFGLVWYMTPDSSGRQFKFGRRRDIAL